MKILVTGAAGFIGSHLCEKLLSSGHIVTGIDNFDSFYSRDVKQDNLRRLKEAPNFVFLEIDIEIAQSLSQLPAGFDVVIHLAAKAGVQPSINDAAGYLRTNLTGTQHLLEWIKTSNIRKLIFASSSSVYGNNRKVPFSESDTVDNPISPYAFSKKSAELLTYTYHHLYGIDVVNLRFFTVYGPRQRPDLAIHKFFKLIYAGKPITIYGDGSTSRDYTFVDDTVQGILNAVSFISSKTGIFEVFNLGNSHPVKLSDLVASIYKVVGSEPMTEYQPMQPGDVDITYADITKAQQLLGYAPNTPLESGLIRFNDWFKGSHFKDTR